MVLAIYLCNRDWVKPEAMDPDHVDKARVRLGRTSPALACIACSQLGCRPLGAR